MSSSTFNPPFTLNDLLHRLRQTDSIPALDENVTQLCKLTGNNDANATELTLIIMRDAAITSRLLAMANSVVYRQRTPVKTVSAAVILLGFERVQQLCLGLSLFNKHAANIRDKELYRLLVCAYCTGNLAMHMARLLDESPPEELFVTGLLRQLPRLVLANGFPDLYRKMDQMVVSGKCAIDAACQHVYGLRFEDIAEAIAKQWSIAEPAVRQGPEGGEFSTINRRRAVNIAVDVADMLFGNRPAGPEPIAAAAHAIGKLLNVKDVSLPEFVGATACGDPNMSHFFNLTEQDLVMMTRIAEWGKVSSSEVANSLTANFEKRPDPVAEAEPPLQMAHFLSELMMSVRKHYDFKDILMMAQEGIYRCIRPDCVIASFIDRDRKYLQGRLYAGKQSNVVASRCRVTLNAIQRQAALNMQSDEVTITHHPDHAILDDDRMLVELDISSVLLAPIMSGNRAIGQFLLGRKSGQAPFTPDDGLWMAAIAGHVGMSFEQMYA